MHHIQLCKICCHMECTKNKKPVIRTLTGTKIILSQRVNGLTNDNNDDKRSRSPSPSSLTNSKRISSTFKPSMISSPNILSDRTNQIIINNDNQLLSKGIKRKLNTNRYMTLDFENDTDDFF
ncbi:unnamed protein product [Rotaria sordida]|uniref:Uncharacterized protein n=1 Tax=Rotaria sordida TaxID=392033 RepID=A0A815E4C8_9BILA|nr:unnamed protein product [Rotaria sordida]